MRPLIYGSVCSGIEAATVAWHGLGWKAAFFSEIEAFPRAVLANRWPEVFCHGDFTTIEAEQYGSIDILVGGTPCQAFSVAGLRGGLADSRGNLALEFIKLAQRKRPRWIVWENVPGVFSSISHDAPDPCEPPDNLEEGAEWVGEDEYECDESHAFSCFLAGLSTIGYGWAYRKLDAQYFGLAQRRERVFVVGYLGDWRPAAQVLFERESLRWDTPPRRGARQDITGTLEARATGGGGGWGTDWMLGGGIVPGRSAGADVPVSGVRNGVPAAGGAEGAEPDPLSALRGGGQDRGPVAFGGNNQSGPIEVSTALNACGSASGRQDFETETFVCDKIAGALRVPSHGAAWRGDGSDNFICSSVAGALQCGVTHALQTQCGQATEDGGGRGAPLVPVLTAFDWQNSAGAPNSDDTTMTLCGDRTPAIAFSAKDYGNGAAEDLSPTLRAMGHAGSHANGGGQMAVAFAINQRDEARPLDVAGALATQPGMRQQSFLGEAMAVRRLTPRECERLQGFPDNYSLIPTARAAAIAADHLEYLRRSYPGLTEEDAMRLAADGPRYKALGNSMAVPCMRWIGECIAAVDAVWNP